MKLIVFHGTAIEKADSPDAITDNLIFSNLSTGYSDLATLWFSPSREVAEYFSQSALGKVAEGIELILEGEIEVADDQVYRVTSGEHYCDVDDCEYHVADDREALYQALAWSGYRVLIVEGNYPCSQGDDVALFDSDLFRATRAYLKVNDKPNGERIWTGPINDLDAMEAIVRRIHFPEPLGSPEPEPGL